jgi:hypothetical protein
LLIGQRPENTTRIPDTVSVPIVFHSILSACYFYGNLMKEKGLAEEFYIVTDNQELVEILRHLSFAVMSTRDLMLAGKKMKSN